MSTTPYFIIFGIVCLIGLFATLWVGRNPAEANYDHSAKKRTINLTVIYLITIVLFAVIAGYFVFSNK